MVGQCAAGADALRSPAGWRFYRRVLEVDYRHRAHMGYGEGPFIQSLAILSIFTNFANFDTFRPRLLPGKHVTLSNQEQQISSSPVRLCTDPDHAHHPPGVPLRSPMRKEQLAMATGASAGPGNGACFQPRIQQLPPVR